jgi:hypothetical protein
LLERFSVLAANTRGGQVETRPFISACSVQRCDRRTIAL